MRVALLPGAESKSTMLKALLGNSSASYVECLPMKPLACSSSRRFWTTEQNLHASLLITPFKFVKASYIMAMPTRILEVEKVIWSFLTFLMGQCSRSCGHVFWSQSLAHAYPRR